MPLDATRIDRAIAKLSAFFEKAPQRPSAKQVHDLRTNVRRVEATVAALSLAERPNEGQVLRDLARLRKRAGKVRDMDVLTGCAATLDVRDEEGCRVELLEYLGAERYRHATKLHAMLRRDGTALRRRLKRTRQRIDEHLANAGTGRGDAGADALTEVMAAAAKLRRALDVPAKLGVRTLHRYRVKVKALRNVLQIAPAADHRRFVDALGRIKDAIGEWHDWERLIAIALEVLDHGQACDLVREARRTSRRKLEHALGLIDGMRRER